MHVAAAHTAWPLQKIVCCTRCISGVGTCVLDQYDNMTASLIGLCGFAHLIIGAIPNLFLESVSSVTRYTSDREVGTIMQSYSIVLSKIVTSRRQKKEKKSSPGCHEGYFGL